MGSGLSNLFKCSRNHPTNTKGESQELDSETCNVPEYADESAKVISEWEVIPSDVEENGQSDLQRDRAEPFSASNLRNREVNSADLQNVGLHNGNTSNVNHAEELLNIILMHCNDWKSIGQKLGFSECYLCGKARFVEYLTWLFWKAVLRTYSEGDDIIQHIERGSQYLGNIDHSFWDLHYPEFAMKEKFTDLPRKICSYIYQWRRFARSFDISENQITSIGVDESRPDEEKCYDVMKEILKNDTLGDLQSWDTWKTLLSDRLFGGDQIVSEIENDYPYLREGPNVEKKAMQKDTNLPRERKCKNILEEMARKIVDTENFLSMFEGYGGAFSDKLSLIESVTFLLWKFILKEDSEFVDHVRNVFPCIHSDDTHFADLPLKKFMPENAESIPGLICELLDDWVSFIKALETSTSKFNRQKKKSWQHYYLRPVGEIIKVHCHPFAPPESLDYWSKYLFKFQDGFDVFIKIKNRLNITHQITSDSFEHAVMLNQNLTIMHQCILHYGSIFRIVDDQGIAVNLDVDIFEFQTMDKFSKMYNHWYEMLHDIKRFDFSHKISCCLILDSIETFLNNYEDNGFVYKGYNLSNHYHLFSEVLFSECTSSQDILAYIENDGVLLHIKFGTGETESEKIESIIKLWKELKNDVELAQAIHKCVRERSIVHVGVVVCDETLIDKVCCKDCQLNGLIVSKEVLSSPSGFSNWYQKTVKENRNFINFRKIHSSHLEGELSKQIKTIIMAYMSFNHKSLPFFTYFCEVQMNELKKLLKLTGCQMRIFYSPHKHKIIKGGYGSGKSIVLQNLFISALTSSVDARDVFFYICYDTMSKYHEQVKSQFSKYFAEKRAFILNVQDLLTGFTFNISDVLRRLKETWKSSCCHFFIDEFNGSQLTKAEVHSLCKVLRKFTNSHINIAVQSFEYKGIEEDSGFQYNYLANQSDFKLFQLKYSLRCSKEINEFVNDSIEIFKDSILERPRLDHLFVSPDYTIVDAEMVHDTLNSKYNVQQTLYKHFVMFNQPKEWGHNVEGGNVCMTQISETEESLNLILKMTLDLDLEGTKVFKIISRVLEMIEEDYTIENKKVTICASNQQFYKIVARSLSHLRKKWTYKVKDFISEELDYEVLLTDPATIRGFEFPNFIFFFDIAKKYTIYRLIESFTRATTKLYLLINVEEQKITDNAVAQNLLKLWRSHCNVEKKPEMQSSLTENFDGGTSLCRDSAQGPEFGLENVGLQNEVSSTASNSKRIARPLEIDSEKEDSYRFPMAYSANYRTHKDMNEMRKNDKRDMLELIYQEDNVSLFDRFVSANKLNPVTYRTPERKSYLHFAAQHDAINISKLLVFDYYMKVNESFYNDPTPLDDAVKSDSPKVTKFLLNHIFNSTGEENLTMEQLQRLVIDAKEKYNCDSVLKILEEFVQNHVF